MNNSKIINEVKLDYQQKRLNAEERCSEFIEELCKDEQFNKVYLSYNSTQLKILRAEYENEKLQLQADANCLKHKLENLLKEKNLNLSVLSPKYDCQICNDTGLNNGKLCDCIKKEIAARTNAKLNSQTGFKTFSDCDNSRMNEDYKKIYELLKKWCIAYPDIKKTNINLLGAPGTGKTFLLECVTSELMRNGYTVCYKTAFEFNELARLYHMGKNFDYSLLIDAPVLVIDDLGTEPMLNNVTKEYLYNLINTRQIHKRPTFISTNLSLDNLLERYDERIFSRLLNKALSITATLTGKDNRIN